jgi:hypothetical protein
MNTNDQKPHVSVEEAHERAQEDVRMGKQADVEAAGAAQMEAERKQPSHVQAQAREAAASKANAEEHDEPKERANVEKAQETGWQGKAADPHPDEQHRQSHERLQSQEKTGQAAAETRSSKQAEGDGYDYPVTEQRMDTMASAATTDTPEARENEAGPTDNISKHGAYSDNPDEVDQISGPPLESISKDKVDQK